MNKRDFTSELKELMYYMSEEEIRKAISALAGCRSDIYSKTAQEKSDLIRLLAAINRNGSELSYKTASGDEGVIKAAGASILHSIDYSLCIDCLPDIADSWWLYDKCRVLNGSASYYYDDEAICSIRPVIIIEDIFGDLQPGESFFINYEKFILLRPYLAIRASCLEDKCTFNGRYDRSIVRFSVDGWYQQLIRENGKSMREKKREDD